MNLYYTIPLGMSTIILKFFVIIQSQVSMNC